PQTWNLGFLNSARFIFTGLQPEGAPWRERLPLEVSWWGIVEGAKPWVARVSYVGEVTLRIGQPASNGSVAETQLPPRYGEIASADVQIPAGRQLVSVVY